MGGTFCLINRESIHATIVGLHFGEYEENICDSDAKDSKLSLEMKISH
jgi:hypothetical protein